MDAINNFDPQALLNTIVSLAIAFLLGSVIGVKRQIR